MTAYAPLPSKTEIAVTGRHLAVLTGLAAEVRLVQSAQAVRCGAADIQIARRAMRDMIAAGATHCLSFGLAGGLEPGLPSGSIVIADHVTTGGVEYGSDPAWIAALADALPEAHVGGVCGADGIVAAPRGKMQLYKKSRALVCDMESHIVAELADAAYLPFIALRVICDPAEFALPPAAILPLRRDGTTHGGAILRSILRRPGQIGDMMRLGGHYRRAMAGLRRAAEAL